MEKNEQNTSNVASENTTDVFENKEISGSVKDELVQKESTDGEAGAESDEVLVETKETLRWLALKETLYGVGLIIIGAVFTAISSTKIYIGAFAVGGFYLLKAIYHLLKSAFKN